MNPQEKFERFVARYPHDHTHFLKRPVYSRRQWFQVLGAGVSGYFLAGPNAAAQTVPRSATDVATQNKARSCIFILLAGAPSHTEIGRAHV